MNKELKDLCNNFNNLNLDEKRQATAATLIQNLDKKSQAATLIQKVWRSYNYRSKNLPNSLLNALEKSAITML